VRATVGFVVPVAVQTIGEYFEFKREQERRKREEEERKREEAERAAEEERTNKGRRNPDYQPSSPPTAAKVNIHNPRACVSDPLPVASLRGCPPW
jgi:sRNA-binding protein